jgi:phosphoribosylformylglycinamidine cyclo-ligase
MYRVFNMGVGMVIVCSMHDMGALVRLVPEAKMIGEVVEQKGRTRTIID